MDLEGPNKKVSERVGGLGGGAYSYTCAQCGQVGAQSGGWEAVVNKNALCEYGD